MARKYLTPIDLTGLELTNFKVQNLSSNPSAYGKGHTYFNTSANELRVYDGSAWVAVGGSVESGSTGSRPAAGNAGRLYFDTTLSVLFFDNGTSWTQDGVSSSDLSSAISAAALASTDDLTEGTTNLYYLDSRARAALSASSGISYNSTTGAFTADYTAIESQLVTDGFATASSTTEFSNKSFSDDIIVGGAVYVGGTTNHGLDVDGSGNTELGSTTGIALSANNDITLTSSNGDIVLNPDGSAYIGSVSANNRIATIGDVNTDTYVKSVSSPLAVDGSGNLTVDLTAYLTTSDASSTYLTQSDASSTYLSQSNASSTYLSQSDASSTYATQSSLSSYLTTSDASSTYLSQSDASSTYQTQSGLDSAVSGLGYAKTVDIPSAYITSVGSNLSVTAGELDLGADVVITDSVQTLSNKTISDKLNFTGYTSPGADGYIWTNTSTGSLELWSEYDIRLSPSGIIDAVGTEAHATKIEFHLADDTNQGVVLAHPSDGSLTVAAINQLHLESHSGNITLTPENIVSVEGGFQTSSGYNITSGNNIYAAHTIYAGGTDTETDGALNIQDANGNNTVVMYGSNGYGHIETHGEVALYRGYNDGGTQYGSIFSDAGANLIIHANNNDVILTSDSGYAYIGNNDTPATRIATISDVQSAQAGLNVKLSVAAITTTAVNIAADLVVGYVADGVTLAANDRVIVAGNAGAENGIYVIQASGGAVRSDDQSTVVKGDFAFVEGGTTYGKTGWIVSYVFSGTTPTTWTQFSAAGEYTAGDGISIDGSAISVKINGDTLSESGSGLSVNLADGGGLSTDGGIYVMAHNGVTVDGSGYVSIDTDVVVRKYAATVGDGTNTSYAVTHNFGTRDVQVAVYDAATYEEVVTDITRTSTNVVTIGFAAAPSADAYRVVVQA